MYTATGFEEWEVASAAAIEPRGSRGEEHAALITSKHVHPLLKNSLDSPAAFCHAACKGGTGVCEKTVLRSKHPGKSAKQNIPNQGLDCMEFVLAQTPV